jgi:phosphoribosylglycinamide formyltransferase-1
VPARLVVLASGSGTTLQALLDASQGASAGSAFGGQVVAAGSDIAGCLALTRAAAAGVATFAVELGDDRRAWNAALGAAVDAFEPDLVVLAGFMRILAPDFVRRFRIVNTHPSLLPAFPGAHALRDALAAGVASTGVTVHWVDDGVDTGPIIAQLPVPITAGEDEDSLRARVQAIEKPLFVETISQLCKEFA